MPRGDGRGPLGKGPMTGRGPGRCSGNNNIGRRGGLFSLLKQGFSGIGRMTGNGQGSGRSRGRGMGDMDRGYRNFNGNEEQERPGSRILTEGRASQEAAQLREKARQMEEELNALQRKINDLESKKPASKVLANRELCTGCGRCEDICPLGAISVKSFAEIDHNLCTLCSKCVNECPAKALAIA